MLFEITLQSGIFVVVLSRKLLFWSLFLSTVWSFRKFQSFCKVCKLWKVSTNCCLQSSDCRTYCSLSSTCCLCFGNLAVNSTIVYETLYAIWYHLYNLKDVKNTHGGVLLWAKLQPATLLKVTLFHGCFSRF